MKDQLEYDANGTMVPAFICGSLPPVIITSTVDTSTPSTNAINADDNQLVLMTVSADCKVAFGATPVASATSMQMWAKSTYFFFVKKGHKIAVFGAATANIKLHGKGD